MSSLFRKVYDNVVYKMAFQPPECSYGAQENILFTTTRMGDKIAMRCVSDTGREMSKPSEYEAGKRLLICAHGNADDIGTFDQYAKQLAVDQGRCVLWFDFCGYGRSAGVLTTERNMSDALVGVVEYATNVLHVPQNKIVLFGKSIGTAPVIKVAAQSNLRGVGGVVLVSPLASGVRATVPAYIATADAFGLLDSLFADNLRLITRVEAPVLLVHGYNDTIIDVVNSRMLQSRLSRSSSYPPLYVAAGHNDIESQHPVIFKKTVRDFLKHCDKAFDIQAETEVAPAQARLIDVD